MGSTKNLWVASEQDRAEREAARHNVSLREWLDYEQDQRDQEEAERRALSRSDGQVDRMDNGGPKWD